MEIIDVEEVISIMTVKIKKMREDGELKSEDEFTLIQPLANGQMVTVIDTPSQTEVTVSDFYRILPKINKSLNIYNTEGKSKDNE